MTSHPSLNKWLALSASFCVVLSLLVGLFITFKPVDVIKDWTIEVPETSYHADTSIILQSRYVKVMNVSGQAFRYIECLQQGVWTRYPLQPAQANRGASTQAQATGIVLQLPNHLPNLPLTCRIAISVDYEIYSFRKFNEYNVSNSFTLLPPESGR